VRLSQDNLETYVDGEVPESVVSTTEVSAESTDVTFTAVDLNAMNETLATGGTAHHAATNGSSSTPNSTASTTAPAAATAQQVQACFIENDNVVLNAGNSVTDNLAAHLQAPQPTVRLHVQTSQQYVNARSSGYLTKIFPTLFCHGTGLPSNASPYRRKNMSYNTYAALLLRHSDKRFANDSTFVFTAFDKVSRDRGSSYMCTKVSRAARAEALTATPAQLESTLLWRLACANAARCGRAMPPRPEDLGNAPIFLRNTEAAERQTYGSDGEREQRRLHCFSIQNLFGQPSIFLTLNPYDLADIVLLRYVGADLANYDGLPEGLLPTKAERQSAISKDPAAAARWFHDIVYAFIEDVLHFDMKTKRAGKSGIFGPVKAVMGSIEEQVRYLMCYEISPRCKTHVPVPRLEGPCISIC